MKRKAQARAGVLPRFGYPALDTLMDSIERGSVMQLDFFHRCAVKNDLRHVRNACRRWAHDGLPASQISDAVSQFFDAVRDSGRMIDALVLKQDRKGKGAGHGKRRA